LPDTARVKRVEAAKAECIELKQTCAKEGPLLGYKPVATPMLASSGECACARPSNAKAPSLADKGTLIVGARVFPGTTYDGHTQNEQVAQAAILMQASDFGQLTRQMR
jgi:hypothetical protein